MGFAIKLVKSVCRSCHGGCDVLIHVKDGKVVKVEGDPESPISHGTLCAKGLASMQLVDNPKRLQHPLKRTGERGEGKFQRIGWSEALDIVAGKLKEIKQKDGAESVVFAHGTDRAYLHFVHRLVNLFGAPNVTSPGYVCYIPRVGSSIITCGGLPICDYDNNPNCVMVWGCNPVLTNPDEYKAIKLCKVLNRGAKLIVVDPRFTQLASRADLWLQLRPGTDTALALGMLNVIIREELYDKKFVEKWTFGFDKLAQRIEEYPLAKVEEITWVPAPKIEKAARLYAEVKPATLHYGVKLEQNLNCSSNHSALIALMAITGNLGTPGGNVLYPSPPVVRYPEFMLTDKLSPEQRAKRLGGEKYKLANMMSVVPPMLVCNAILEEDPYPVKAIAVFGSNPLLTWPNSKRVREALMKLEFIMIADPFMTPTAQLADIVLPVASWLEYNDVAAYFFRGGHVQARVKAVEVGESWSDHKIINELGKKLGYEEYFWDDVDQYLDYILKPSGMTWDEFKEKGIIQMERKNHEEKGFSTSTRKVELYSTVLESWGYDPLPFYAEPPESPISRPDLAEKYPLILTTGARSPVFFHTEHRQIPWLREIHQYPMVEVHPETAKKHGIHDDDWVFIETPRGKIKQKAKLSIGIHPKVVHIQHAWWFPEREEPGFGWSESNANILTDSNPPFDPCIGASNLVGLLCKIYKAEEGKA